MSNIKKFTDDEVLTAAQLNNTFETALRLQSLNAIQQLQDRSLTISPDSGSYVEAYTAAAGRTLSVDSGKSSAIFSTDEYTNATGPFVIITASAISSLNDFAINNCKLAKVSSGKWQLTCTTGTDEVRRAQIYKTLFYGSDGTDPRASSTYITSITALKTSVTRDVGKQAHYLGHAVPSQSIIGSDNRTFTWAFNNTSTNTDCSAWSLVGNNTASLNTRFELPTSTTVNTASNSTSDETGTDRSADEADNPADLQIEFDATGSGTAQSSARVIVICKGTLGTVSESGTGLTGGTTTDVDFNADNSIPLFTEATEDLTSFVEASIPAGSMGLTMGGCYVKAKIVPQKNLGTVTHVVESRKRLSTDRLILTNIGDCAFKSDGTEVYLADYNSAEIWRYTLSTAYDLRTATYTGKLDVSSEAAVPRGVAIKSDGTQIYVLDNTTDDVFAYDLSTAYDLNTGSYSGDSISLTTQDTSPYGLFFKPDGTEMYVCGDTGDTVEQYTLSVAWDVTSATTTNSEDVSSETTSPRGVTFNSDGTVMLVMSGGGTYPNHLLQYTLSSAYDISTSTFDASLNVLDYVGDERGVSFAPGDNTKVYFCSTLNDGLIQIDLTTASDIGGTVAIDAVVDTTSTIADGELASFTAFTGTPTNIITTLTPTTNGVVSINGVTAVGDKPA